MRALLLAAFSFAIVSVPVHGKSSADAPEKASDGRDKMICKRFIRTGSLIDAVRTCKSKQDWERERAQMRQLDQVDSCRTRGMTGTDC